MIEVNRRRIDEISIQKTNEINSSVFLIKKPLLSFLVPLVIFYSKKNQYLPVPSLP